MRKRTGKKRGPGRPKGPRPPLRTFTFRVDDATAEALAKLVAAAPPGTINPKGSAIRRAIIEAAQRLEEQQK